MVVPPLTTQRGKRKMPLKKVVLVISALYTSHSFSAWGDRMWGFVVSLLLALLYPGSLLLPGVHGFVVQLTVAIFGTIVGDWVDSNSRMKVAVLSLIIQNGLLSLSSVAMALMFYFDWNVCLNVKIFSALTVVVIVLVSGANLATVANTISIEKDWVVVIADGNKDTLAVLNANMRRIDLCCKLLAPALTGVILQHAYPFTTTVIVAVWNIVSFFGELGLLWIVYKLIPDLAVKKLRSSKFSNEVDETLNEDKEGSLDDSIDREDEVFIKENHDANNKDEKLVTFHQGNNCFKQCIKLMRFFSTFKDGWRIYISQEIALVGFSLASIYLTVLGFSGVTSSYFLTQGLRYDLIGVFQGVGAIFGVLGTIIYPFLRKKFGTIRTGLFGITTQLLILLFCVVGVSIPSNRTSGEVAGYYSADCRNYLTNDTVNETAILASGLCESATMTVVPSYTVSPTPTVSSVFPMPTPSLDPECNSESSDTTNERTISITVILMLVGIVGCRIGLWIFDLAVQQLVQEKVAEEERGVVSGIMNAMNSIMDMIHYVLVIAAPRPEHFYILTGISFAMVALGWLLYSIYVRKTRGHFFHFRDFSKYVRQKWTRRIVSFEDGNDPD